MSEIIRAVCGAQMRTGCKCEACKARNEGKEIFYVNGERLVMPRGSYSKLRERLDAEAPAAAPGADNGGDGK